MYNLKCQEKMDQFCKASKLGDSMARKMIFKKMRPDYKSKFCPSLVSPEEGKVKNDQLYWLHGQSQRSAPMPS